MIIHSPMGEGLHFPQIRPDRRWIRFFVKHYTYLVGIATSLIIIASLYYIDVKVMSIALLGYWVYVGVKVRNRSNPKWVSLYQSVLTQFVRTLFLITGVSILLGYVYTHTDYLDIVKVDTLWLLYLMAISVISQRGSRIWFILTLTVVIISLYIVSPVEGKVILSFPFTITLEIISKVFWLVSLSGLTYILLRYMSDAVADINLIVNVQNHIREMEGKFLRSNMELNKDDYLEKSVEIIRNDLHYDHVNVYRLDSYTEKLTCVAAACPSGKKLVEEGYTVNIQEQESIIGHVAKTGLPHVTNHTGKDPHYLPTPAFPKTKSELVVPIRSRNRLYGVLDIQVQQRDYFLDQDLKALQILANNIGWVVDNSEQFEHFNWINHIIQKIAMPIFTQNYLDDTLQEIADVAQQELGTDLVILYSYDPDTKEGALGPIYAGEPMQPELLQHVSQENDNVVLRLIANGDPIYCYENLNELVLTEHPLFRPSPTHRATGRPTFIEREKIQANAIIRLLNNEQCVGILFLNFRKPRTFTFWDKQRYFSFAHLAALAIQKMHSQQHEIKLEMTDLSNHIHDTLIGDTLGLHKVLNSMDLSGKSIDVEKIQTAVNLAKTMTDQLHNDIRYISGLLKDNLSNDMQVELDKLAIIFRQVFRIKIDLKWNVDNDYLPQTLSRELLIVVREAVTNAVKHARANSITITGTVKSNILHIRVSDNGRGFDPKHVRRVNGLASMRYRMTELGGDFNLVSEPGKGATIDLSIPVNKEL
ncbi:MAG: GAF domain-containing protein [Chloroflexi bacterium]|nr:GAF domain-containing protein [Chloroflexota bacterium]